MRKLAEQIIKHYRSVIILYFILAIISCFTLLQVKVRFDLSHYLPPASNSTRGLKLLKQEFNDAIPNLNLAIKVDSLTSALQFKQELLHYPGVQSVRFLDDITDITLPLKLQKADYVKNYLQKGFARYELVVQSNNYGHYIQKLKKDMAPREIYLSGQALDMASANLAVGKEVTQILFYAVPLALLILFLISSSALEPFIFLITIFLAVLLNMGTNFLKGDLSFITQSIAGIMQLAVSMDYAIFLLHQFKLSLAEGDNLQVALVKAVCRSFSSITSSAVTTFFGFIVLLLMSFTLGWDMGIVLAKGIVFSLICVLTFLPCLIRLFAPLISKLSYKPPLRAERFGFLAAFARKFRLTYLIIALLLLPLAFIAQKRCDISYGMGNLPANSPEFKAQQQLESVFGRSLLYVVMVNRKDSPATAAMTAELKDLPHVNTVISYANQVGNDVPKDSLPPALIKQLVSPSYERIIIQSKLKADSKPAFALAQAIRKIADKHLKQPYYTVGEAFTLLDMKKAIEHDNIIINYFIIGSVFFVLLCNFRNIIVPLLIVLTIEFSIWLNLAVPYFSSTRLNFIGYLVINTFQLGATVDYGILLCEKYLNYRKTYPKLQAYTRTLKETCASLMAPAFILSGCSYILALISSINAVSEIGQVLGRGALLSLANVLLLLPNLLYWCDKLIEKSDLNPLFVKLGNLLLKLKRSGKNKAAKSVVLATAVNNKLKQHGDK